MRDRLARLLYALGTRIERRPTAHRANSPVLFEDVAARERYGRTSGRSALLIPPHREYFAPADDLPPERRESRGWN